MLKENELLDAMDSIENAIQISEKNRNEWTINDYINIIRHIEKYDANSEFNVDGNEKEWKELLRDLKAEYSHKFES